MQEKFPQNSDPRLLGFFLADKLNPEQTLGFQICMMAYSAYPENLLPKELKNKKAFMDALNAIVDFQNNKDVFK